MIKFGIEFRFLGIKLFNFMNFETKILTLLFHFVLFCFFNLVVLAFFFKVKVLSPSYPETCSVEDASLELTGICFTSA